jgi:uncharacterized protein
MPRYKLIILLTLLWLTLTVGLGQAQSGYPQPEDGYVNDYAEVMTLEDTVAIRTLFADLGQDHGVEAAVVTIGSIQDYDTGAKTIETFATTLFNYWGIGDQNRNDGVLLLVAVNDRNVRIEVGSGYGDSQNAAMQEVINEHILPSFRQDQLSQGVYRGARAIVGQLTGEWPPDMSGTKAASAGPLANIPFWLYGGGGAVAALGLYRVFRRRSRSSQRCPQCRATMRLLDDSAADNYLDKGQSLEKSLKAINHQVWLCPKCQHHRLDSQPQLYTPIDACPTCNYRTVKTTVIIKKQPTTTKSGKQRVLKHCQQCDYHTEYMVDLSPKKRTSSRYSSSDSYSSYDSFSSSSSSSDSGSSFDGGSSSGGGASGDW